MKRFSAILYLIISFHFISIGCAHNRASDIMNLTVKEIKISSWLNLMPGGPGSFHISGKIFIRNKESYDINKLSLVNVLIKQRDMQLYNFVPIFLTKDESDDTCLLQETEKEFSFHSPPVLHIKKDLESDLPIKIFLKFKEENDYYFNFEIENIKVEKVY